MNGSSELDAAINLRGQLESRFGQLHGRTHETLGDTSDGASEEVWRQRIGVIGQALHVSVDPENDGVHQSDSSHGTADTTI